MLTQRTDGLNQSDQPTLHSRNASRSSSSSSTSSFPGLLKRSPDPPAGSPTSHVQWIPLSPQSSQTLLRHRAQSRSLDRGLPTTDSDAAGGNDNVKATPSSSSSRDETVIDTNKPDYDETDASSAIVAVAPQQRRIFRKRRRNASDPSMDRPQPSSSTSRRQHDRGGSDRSDSEDEIEVLPDRFDRHGRPMDGPAAGGPSRQQQRGWTSRRGDFEYRSPRGSSGTHVRGTWGVAGTDPEQVERMVRDVTGLIGGEGVPRGVGGWLGLAGKLLGGVMAPPGANADNGEPGSSGRGAGRGERSGGDVAYGGGGSDVSRDGRGKGRRRGDDHGYGEAGEEDEVLGEEGRRRRRRKRREVDG